MVKRPIKKEIPMKEKDTYGVHAICTNCFDEIDLELDKKVLVTNIKCKNCCNKTQMFIPRIATIFSVHPGHLIFDSIPLILGLILFQDRDIIAVSY